MGTGDSNRVTFTVVGSGTAVPEPDRVCSGYFLETGDLRILLDCGSGVVHHLAAFALEWPRITHLALSHFHNDHIGDLPMLFFALEYGMLPPRREPLTIIGPAGLADRMRRLADALGDHVSDPGFDVELIELAHGEVALAGGTRLTVHRTPHTDDSIAYRIENDA
ncbi:MAG: ribonuclease Z, partial [Longimicrobiales bacterium]